ncbi:coiledcoil domain containing [Perkinsus olseni]|uniref:Coiledcoil domain containing n=1 Tax=Perkinsus olseni TaxID=32597 RepID=A0A7J6RK97_PEROL|nr:coiledcoil domain containing [Perkinsus olseni]
MMAKHTRGFGSAVQSSDAEKKSIEAEIQQLQRNFHVLENDKRNYGEVSQGVIRKQRATIMKLSRENKKMKQEVNDTRAFTASRSEHKIGSERLQRTQVIAVVNHVFVRFASPKEEKDRIDARLRDESARGELIDDRIGVLQKKIRSLREELARRGGVNAAKETNEALDKQIKILDNRLEKNLQKFNEVIAVNTSLRDRIDSLRRERVVFDSIYRKLEIELQEKKKEMANIIEQANAAYEARDQAQAQMTALKQQADREHIEFEKEWKELGRLIENDKKMKEFMRQREKARIEDSGKSGDAHVVARGDLSVDDENKLRKQVNQSAWGIAKDKVAIRTTADKVEVYEEAFGRIQSATGISDIDELVQNFIAAEDQNFSLFNYANQLSGDIKKLEASVGDLTLEFNALKTGGTASTPSPPQSSAIALEGVGDGGAPESVKQKFLSDLEERWSGMDKKAEHYELKYQQAMKTLTSVRAGIQSIFNRLGCDPPPLAAMGDTQSSPSPPPATTEGSNEASVSESAMLPYLGVIEKSNISAAVHSVRQRYTLSFLSG